MAQHHCNITFYLYRLHLNIEIHNSGSIFGWEIFALFKRSVGKRIRSWTVQVSISFNPLQIDKRAAEMLLTLFCCLYWHSPLSLVNHFCVRVCFISFYGKSHNHVTWLYTLFSYLYYCDLGSSYAIKYIIYFFFFVCFLAAVSVVNWLSIDV